MQGRCLPSRLHRTLGLNPSRQSWHFENENRSAQNRQNRRQSIPPLPDKSSKCASDALAQANDRRLPPVRADADPITSLPPKSPGNTKQEPAALPTLLDTRRP